MGIETLAIAAIAGGTALKMIGDVAAGQQQQYAYEAKARADLFNAQVANNRARNEREAAAAQRQDLERAGSAKLGHALALQGGTGVTPEGSPLMVDSQLIREIALGAERTTYMGEKRARGLQDEAALLEQSAAYASYAGGIARDTGYLKAGTSLLGGVGSYALAKI